MNLIELIETNSIVAVDLETTGLNCGKDYIIEIGAVKIEGGESNTDAGGRDFNRRSKLNGVFFNLCKLPYKVAAEHYKSDGHS